VRPQRDNDKSTPYEERLVLPNGIQNLVLQVEPRSLCPQTSDEGGLNGIW